VDLEGSDMRRLLTCEKARGVVEVGAFFVLAVTMIFIAIQSCSVHKQTNLLTDQINILQSDYEARTRPYLSIAEMAFREESNSSVYLIIAITNYGELPAMNLELQQMSVEAGLDTVWISVIGKPDIVVFPGRYNRIPTFSIDKTDYEETILQAKVLTIKLIYSCGDKNYWYEAETTLQSGGNWSIDSERCN